MHTFLQPVQHFSAAGLTKQKVPLSPDPFRMFSSVLIGWYTPVAVLMVRDPLVREVILEACSRGVTSVAAATATFLRWGGVALFRNAACVLKRMRRLREEEWFLL